MLSTMTHIGPEAVAAFVFEGRDRPEGIRYGPLGPDEARLRLLGPLAGRRLLVLGADTGRAAVYAALAGARVIAVEPDAVAAALLAQRAAAARAQLEVHARDLAELAFVRAETIDVALAVQSLARVPDPVRVFRQVHRVLRPEAPIVFSLPHPALPLVHPDGPRPYGGGPPRPVRVDTELGPIEAVAHSHTIGGIVVALGRTNFSVDALVEPVADAEGAPSATGAWHPSLALAPTTLVMRARRLGR
jgi:SAM-dependent methyltransferase